MLFELTEEIWNKLLDFSDKLVRLSGEVMRLSRNTLLVNLRFMDAALSRLTPVALPGDICPTLMTDGQFLAYCPVHILNIYRAEESECVRDYLHAVMHCVFRHMFIHSLLDESCWDLACDIAVENAINELGLKAAECARQQKQQFVIHGLKKDLSMLTAEKLYRYYLDKKLPAEEMEKLSTLFRADDHSLWHVPPEIKAKVSISCRRSAARQQDGQKENKAGDGQQKQNAGDQPQNAGDQPQNAGDQPQNSGDPQQENDERPGSSQKESFYTGMTAAEAETDWADVSQRMQTDMETFSKSRGDTAGGFTQNLREVNREKYDYSEFLKKFAVMGEVMKINDDEFDYIFYTYGLQLYKNMPLIEPLEYKEMKRIREFVIAIDTSGSVQGEEVQTFLNKTYNIMMSTESFFSKVNVHIIQCDATVQEHVKVTSREEFETYLGNMQLHGFGGTDFRPAFSLVEELRHNKEFTNLKGLIYFTDGCGIFPEKKPDYETAFVFVQDGYEIPEVPPWAIRLVLQKEDI